MSDSMFFVLENGRTRQIAREEFDPQKNNVCYISQEVLKEEHNRMGLEEIIFNDLSSERANFRTSLDSYADASVGYLNIINVDDLDGEMDRVMFVVRKNLLCLVRVDDGDGSEFSLFRTIMRQEQGDTTLAKIFYRFLERLLKGGNGRLETIEEELLSLEDQVVHGRADERLNTVIYGYRRQLSLIRNYYEQLVDIAEELEENENELYDERGLSYFRVLATKATRLVDDIRSLNESLSRLREMLDAALNYRMNNIMKVFTMITAIFLPLTLIVGWYGMNFKHMPELDWQHAYPLLAVIFILIVLAILWLFKKKKLM